MPAKDLNRTEALRRDLVRKVAAHTPAEGEQITAVPGVVLYRRSALTGCTSAAYRPRLIVCVQGEKRISVGKNTYVYDGSTFVLATVDMPVMSQVVKASHEEPFLGVLIELDMAMVREIASHQELVHETEGSTPRGLTIGVSPPELLAVCSRLLELLDTPQDIPFLHGLIQREIVYRLLQTPQGRHLRTIATLGNQSQRLAKAVQWLRGNYAKPLRVEELAATARMGVSTLHHQFRSLTEMSPLQYQKQLRLHVARERMLSEGIDAASAAFEVGYESPSQFSREYRRFFGQPPMRDVQQMRAGGVAAD